METRKLTGGVEGSQRLCKALLSARYIEDAMRTWGEEVVSVHFLLLNISQTSHLQFFLELWQEINHRASRRAAGPHASLVEHADDGAATSEGTIFEELVTQFAKLCLRAEDMFAHQICGECEAALKPHFSALAT